MVWYGASVGIDDEVAMLQELTRYIDGSLQIAAAIAL